MWFGIAVVLFALLKYFEVWFTDVSWWWVLLPFGLAVLWWEVIDPMFSVSKKREQRKMEKLKDDRQMQMKKSLGMQIDKKGRVVRRK
jgi:small Trp-rich protein